MRPRLSSGQVEGYGENGVLFELPDVVAPITAGHGWERAKRKRAHACVGFGATPANLIATTPLAFQGHGDHMLKIVLQTGQQDSPGW
jgi:hypothetical protein